MIKIEAEGLGRFKQYFEAAPDLANKAAVLALNQIASRDAMTLIREGIEAEVALPDDYVAPRITVSRKAYHSSLEAVLTARGRPTSLARFAPGQVPRTGKGAGRPQGVRVAVKPGAGRLMKRAFLTRLPRGKAKITDESFNVGLAIRLKKGERIAHKHTMTEFQGGLYLLYGPSVNQVMRHVADDKSPEILDALDNEFLRQFNRLSDKF